MIQHEGGSICNSPTRLNNIRTESDSPHEKIQKVRITHFQEILAKESQECITDADGPNTSFGMLGESN